VSSTSLPYLSRPFIYPGGTKSLDEVVDDHSIGQGQVESTMGGDERKDEGRNMDLKMGV
jgi:hypothetical protein